MDKTRATALVKLLKDLFHPPADRFDEGAQKAYVSFVCEKKNENAMFRAIRGLSESEKFFPSIAVLSEAYNHEARKDLQSIAHEHRLLEERRPEGYGGEPPEWVHVWYWLRMEKHDMRPLPQQFPYLPQDQRPADTLSQEQYEGLRQEWLAAGAPKTTTAQVIRAGA